MLDNLLLIGSAAWRLSYMLVNELGPMDLFLRLRSVIGIDHNEDGVPLGYPDTFFANLFSCVYCMSVWVGFGLYCLSLILSDQLFMIVSFPLAVSTIAIIIDTVVEK